MVFKLMSRGMGASHGYLHNPKGLLTYQDMVRDFQKNQWWLEKRGGKRTPFVSYPYGGRNAVSHDVAPCRNQSWSSDRLHHGKVDQSHS